MIWFEFRKLFKNRLHLIAMVVGYVLIVVAAYSYVMGVGSYDKNTGEELTGRAAIDYREEVAANQTDVLTEEFVTDYLKKLQEYPEDLDTDEAYWDMVRFDAKTITYMANCYTDIQATNTGYIHYNKVKEINLTEGALFYKTRIKKIQDYLDADWTFENYTQAEKEYWMNKAKKVLEPFVWGDITTMRNFMDLQVLDFYLIFVTVQPCRTICAICT